MQFSPGPLSPIILRYSLTSPPLFSISASHIRLLLVPFYLGLNVVCFFQRESKSRRGAQDKSSLYFIFKGLAGLGRLTMSCTIKKKKLDWTAGIESCIDNPGFLSKVDLALLSRRSISHLFSSLMLLFGTSHVVLSLAAFCGLSLNRL